MINLNGKLVDNEIILSANNRGFNYGDALFETMRTSYGKLLYWEDHYFRLMASMRIMRMEIPMDFTMEYLENEINKVLISNKLDIASSRIKLIVFRIEGGLYLPTSNDVGFMISVSHTAQDFYMHSSNFYEVDLFKDHYVSPSLLSTLKTNNKALHVVGSIFAKENQLDNCLVLNTHKHVIEALNGNLFIVQGDVIKTPPLTDGCLNGIMRKQLLNIIDKLPDFTLVEASISPFELQKADELFITNVIVGIQPISKYRKKVYGAEVSKLLLQKLNIKVRLD